MSLPSLEIRDGFGGPVHFFFEVLLRSVPVCVFIGFVHVHIFELLSLGLLVVCEKLVHVVVGLAKTALFLFFRFLVFYVILPL